MSRAELRAQEIFESYNLKDENDDVKRSLMILLLTVPRQQEKEKKSWASKFAGAWQGEETAEEIIQSIRDSRTTNRDIEL